MESGATKSIKQKLEDIAESVGGRSFIDWRDLIKWHYTCEDYSLCSIGELGHHIIKLSEIEFKIFKSRCFGKWRNFTDEYKG